MSKIEFIKLIENLEINEITSFEIYYKNYDVKDNEKTISFNS